jgi:hypothetical protein
MKRLFPRKTEDGTCTKVANLRVSRISNRNSTKKHSITHLDLTPGIEEQILGLQIPMSNALAVEVSDAHQNLLEATLDFRRGHAAFTNSIVEVATGAEFHHDTPLSLVILHEIDSFDDIRVA